MIDNSTKDKLENATPHFGNTLLGAVPSVVYNEDCVEALKRFNDKHFDLAVVDPPYGIGVSEMNIGARKVKNKACDGKGWDNNTPTEEYWNELYRVSKHQICSHLSSYRFRNNHSHLVPMIDYFGSDMMIDGNIFDNPERLPKMNFDDIKDGYEVNKILSDESGMPF